MIAGQVGFAGSSTLGNNVSIGGQAGISGHSKIEIMLKLVEAAENKRYPDDTIYGIPAVL